MNEGGVPEVRKTRRQRQAETRQQVIAAARELFLARGYHRTTLSAVVDAAGFTKGAVYSNFTSKAELALAVVEEIEREDVEQLAEAFQGATDPAERARLLTVWGETILADTAALRLRGELGFAAMDDPSLAETVRHKSRNVRASVAAMLQGLEHTERFRLDVSTLADVLIALASGAGMQKLTDPDFDLQAFVKAVAVLTGAPDPAAGASAA